MDPQKFFLAKTLQGAVDASVLTFEDLYVHISSFVLAEHVPSDILWNVIVEGMQRSNLGFNGLDTTPPQGERFSDPPPAPPQELTEDQALPPEPEAPAAKSSEFEVNEGEVDALFDQATEDEPEDDTMAFEVTDGLDDEMPPIPEEGIIVEEVDWDDEK